MAGLYSLSREAVRVKVKKCEGNQAPEWRKFSVDPQITSLEVLYSILAKAFDIKTEFSLSYKAIDPNGGDVYLAVHSDWDLDAAFLRAHNHSISMNTDACLSLKVDVRPFAEATDCEATAAVTKEVSTIQQSFGVGQKYVQNMQNRLPGLMEKTFSMVTRALNFVEDQNILQPLRLPLSDAEFRSFCDSVGQIVQPNSLREVIYSGGIDPSLRRVVWKHILCVYPDGMTGLQRMEYIKRKSAEYRRLREVWREAIKQEPITGELAYVTSMVRKDVLRTDRLHPFYAGNDENQNIASLFNILTTYALNHPAVSYCQGMSDIASPLLVTMCDEEQAYICFCAIMKRLCTNFMIDGIAMTQKFAHLSEGLQFYDPEFYDYLKMQQADDLLFCYRWLLLEMKREFAFDDSLRMLEVLWSSLEPELPTTELQLFEKEFVAPPKEDAVASKTIAGPVIMRKPRENAYTTLCALRRQSSSHSSLATSPNTLTSTESIVSKALDGTKRLNQSLDDDKVRDKPRNARSITKNYQSLDEIKLRNLKHRAAMNGSIDKPDQTNGGVCVAPKINGQAGQVNRMEHVDASDTGSNLLRQITGSVRKKGEGHFKGLKERIAASKQEKHASFDKIERHPVQEASADASDGMSPKSERIVRNFNEFRNLAPKGVKLPLNRSNSVSDTKLKKGDLRLTKSTHQHMDREDSKCSSVDSEPCDGHLDDRSTSNDGSSPEDSQEYFPMTTSITRELRLEFDNLNRQVFGNSFISRSHSQANQFDCNSPDSADSQISNKLKGAKCSTEISYTKFNRNSEDECGIQADSADLVMTAAPAHELNADVFVWENPLHQLSPIAAQSKQPKPPPVTSNNPFLAQDFLQTLTPDEQHELEYDGEIISESASGKKSITPIRLVNNNHSTDRNSQHFQNDSSSDSTDVKFNQTNPFLMDIVTAYADAEPATQSSDANTAMDAFVDEEASEAETNVHTKGRKSLPAPHEFGGGNPFLMFLCLTLLLQHRNYVMKSAMDYNEIAMHFDKMVRKHNVVRVLNQARRMYADYLKAHRVSTTDTRKGSNVADVKRTSV